MILFNNPFLRIIGGSIMEIPTQVKIKGKPVSVRPSGRGYVWVGRSIAKMHPDKKIELSKYQEKTGQTDQWEQEMYRLFEKALKDERKRLKN